MAQHKPSYGQKLRRAWEEDYRQRFNIAKLKRKLIRQEPKHFIKEVQSLYLKQVGTDIEAEHFEIADQYDEYFFYYEFKNLPEWAITNATVVCLFYTNDGYTFGGLFEGFNYRFQYSWKQTKKATDGDSNTLWELRGYIYRTYLNNPHPTIPSSVVRVPLFCDFKVVFYNRRIYHEIQHK